MLTGIRSGIKLGSSRWALQIEGKEGKKGRREADGRMNVVQVVVKETGQTHSGFIYWHKKKKKNTRTQ